MSPATQGLGGDALTSPLVGAATRPSGLSTTGLHSIGTHLTGFISPTSVPTPGRAKSVSKGEIAGIVIGVLILLIILGASITRCWLRRKAPHILGKTEKSPASHTFDTSNIHGHPVSVQSNSNSTVHNYVSALPMPYSSPDLALSGGLNIHDNTPLSRTSNPNASYSPLPQTTSVQPSKPDYYGGGKYVLSWEAPTSAQESSRQQPSSNSQPEIYAELREADAGPLPLPSTLPPSYNSQWMH